MKETTLCYIENGDSYLLLLRNKKKNDDNAGKWIGVGGKLEDGETPQACLLREVREETGLLLERYRYRGRVTFLSDCCAHELMHLFTTDRYRGTITACDEGTLAFQPKAKLLSLPMWQGDALFLQLLLGNAPFFEMTLQYRGEVLQSAILDGKELTLPWNPC